MRIILQGMWKIIFVMCMLLCAQQLTAQDSLPPVTVTDSVVRPARPVIVKRPPVARPLMKKQDSVNRDSLLSPVKNDLSKLARLTLLNDSILYSYHPFYRFTDPIHYSITLKKWVGKEAIFYSVIALLIFFALIKNGFPRYMDDLFKIFFRTTVKQRQIKEQLVQSPLPSMLLNIFYLISTGLFLSQVFHYFGLGTELNVWILFIYCMAGLMVIYGVKFITLKFFGWIFQVSEAIDSYIFIVFTTNKVIGMALLPFLVVIAFTYGLINQIAFTVSIAVVLGLLAYRFFLSYVSIHRQVSISFFHFLIYLCAFEIIPLLLINKLLFRFLGETS